MEGAPCWFRACNAPPPAAPAHLLPLPGAVWCGATLLPPIPAAHDGRVQRNGAGVSEQRRLVSGMMLGWLSGQCRIESGPPRASKQVACHFCAAGTSISSSTWGRLWCCSASTCGRSGPSRASSRRQGVDGVAEEGVRLLLRLLLLSAVHASPCFLTNATSPHPFPPLRPLMSSWRRQSQRCHLARSIFSF